MDIKGRNKSFFSFVNIVLFVLPIFSRLNNNNVHAYIHGSTSRFSLITSPSLTLLTFYLIFDLFCNHLLDTSIHHALMHSNRRHRSFFHSRSNKIAPWNLKSCDLAKWIFLLLFLFSRARKPIDSNQTRRVLLEKWWSHVILDLNTLNVFSFPSIILKRFNRWLYRTATLEKCTCT